MSTILLVSRDPDILSTRAVVIQSAGYQALLAADLSTALRLAREERPALIVVGHTFTAEEQDGFARSLHQSHSQICILLLRSPFVYPRELLKECRAALDCEAGVPVIREMRD